MAKFLEAFSARAGNDFGTLMTDIEIQPDGEPLDRAAWTDWIHAVAQIRDSN